MNENEFYHETIEYGGVDYSAKCAWCECEIRKTALVLPSEIRIFCSEDCLTKWLILYRKETALSLAERTEWIEIREEGGLWWYH